MVMGHKKNGGTSDDQKIRRPTYHTNQSQNQSTISLTSIYIIIVPIFNLYAAWLNACWGITTPARTPSYPPISS